MKSSCQLPDLQMGLLEAARAGEMPEPELAFHLEGCDDCQAAVERLRRMVSIWVADHEAEGDSAFFAAAARFRASASRRKEARWQGPLPFAFAGALAATVLLLATHRADTRRSASVAASAPEAAHEPQAIRAPSQGRSVLGPAAGGDRSARAVLSVPHVEGPRGVMPLADGLRVELKEGESAHVALANGQASDLRGPCAIEFWSSSTEVGGWRLSPAQPASSEVTFADPAPIADLAEPARPVVANRAGLPEATGAAKRAPEGRGTATSPSEAAPPSTSIAAEVLNDASAVKSSPKIERAWARAAEALRRDDFSAADDAFGELGRAPYATTRDAARLARAQLWIAHGRGAAVRPVLVDLAATGATALVRQRAAEFLYRQDH